MSESPVITSTISFREKTPVCMAPNGITTGRSGIEGGTGAAAVTASTGWPHCSQNFAPGERGAPQAVQNRDGAVTGAPRGALGYAWVISHRMLWKCRYLNDWDTGNHVRICQRTLALQHETMKNGARGSFQIFSTGMTLFLAG